MIWRRLKDYVYSDSRSIEERRFVLAAIMCCISIIVVLITMILTQTDLRYSFLLVIGILIIVLLMIYGIRSRKFTLAGSLILLMSQAFVLPTGYLIGGGIHSGAPLWLILGGVMVFVMIRGRLLALFSFTTFLSFAGSVYLGMLHPEWIIPLQPGVTEEFDNVFSLTIVSGIIGVVYMIQSSVLEYELKKARDKSAEVESLNKAQSNFFTSMSHEIRTPINTIIGLNEMTMREKRLPEDIRENTINIQNASKMLLSIINDLLDMQKIQTGNMEIIEEDYDTSRMLSEITNLHWNNAMEKGLHFDVQVDDTIPQYLHGDENRIKQVVINLISNAIKYTEEGFVVVRFGGEMTTPDQFMLQVEVQDSGMGIRKENIQYLFDAFRRVEEGDTKNIEGTGLGLSIAKRLVDLMGGNISVDSIYTKGSTFRVEIPQGVVEGARGRVEAKKKLGGSIKEYQQSFEAPEASVLIVDDNDMNRMVCQKLLRSTKVKVDLAESGMECLELTKGKHYDAILMDHEMPVMDGLEALRKLKQQPEGLNRDTPVIALTANAGSDKEAFYLENGFSAYLAKPIQSNQLESLLMACLPKELIEQTFVSDEGMEVTISEAVQKIPFMVTTDSICDLPQDVIDENGIRIMPYYIVTRHGRFRDLSEIDADNLRNVMKETDEDIHSDPAPVEEYEEFFGDALSEARVVIHITSSKETTAAFANASKAAESFDNVRVIDSGQISCGLGMVAVYAARVIKSGMSLEEILEDIEEYKRRVRINYLVPSILESGTKYRVGVPLMYVMNVFNMEPMFVWRRGKAKIKRFFLGYARSTPDQFVRYVLRNRRKIDPTRAYVTFSCCNSELREHVLEEIKRNYNFDELIVSKSTASTFINIGPSAFGITFEREA